MAHLFARNRYAVAAIATLSMGILGPLHARAAAMICVQAGDYVGLQNALATAANNGDDDVIMLQAGQYAMPSTFVLDYEPSTEHHDLTIEGGFVEGGGNPCSSRVQDARATVLHQGLLRLKMLGAATGSITLNGLTVENAFSADANNAPVQIFGGASLSSNVHIDNVMFAGNTSSATSAIYAFANLGALHIHNSLFASNASFSTTNAVRLGTLQVSNAFCAEIINSTFAGNVASAGGAEILGQCTTMAVNDIFWGNPNGNDVYFAFPQSTLLSNDDFFDLNEASNTESFDLLSIDPLFNLDFSLQDLSPLRDAGDPGGFLYTPGVLDLVGNPRVHGSKPDIGAYEITEIIFANGFDFQLPF